MKTIIKIEIDYNSNLSHDYFIDEINYLVNEIDIFCEIKNNKYINIIEREKRYNSDKKDYKNKIIIDAIGYCQSEWQTYILYHNLEQDNKELIELCNELKKTFTHFNDYQVTKYNQIEIDGNIFNSEAIDYTSFSIRYIEFPDKKDIISEYNSIYGIDYDEYIIEIN